MSRTRLMHRERFEDSRNELLEYLEHFRDLRLSANIAFPEGFRYRGPEDFILTEGTFFNLADPPLMSKRGTPNACFWNSATAVLRDDRRLRYCEGFALADLDGKCHFQTAHAWVINEQGLAIETTWERPGLAYVGVEIPIDEYIEANSAGSLSVMDDPFRRWPLYKKPYEYPRRRAA